MRNVSIFTKRFNDDICSHLSYKEGHFLDISTNPRTRLHIPFSEDPIIWIAILAILSYFFIHSSIYHTKNVVSLKRELFHFLMSLQDKDGKEANGEVVHKIVPLMNDLYACRTLD